MSLPTSSVLNELKPQDPVHDLPEDHPGQYFFSTDAEALAWRSGLTDQEEDYLYRLDRYLARMKDGTLIDCDTIIKQGSRQLFYRCLSYTLSFTGQVNMFQWSADYKNIKKLTA